jgi:4-amino-4-deoxy-L-arabinose transferase-like glycosyltransferase
MSLFLAPDTLPFAVALALMLCLGVLEGVSLMASFSVSHLIDSLVPESVEADSPLGWLHIGKTPLLVLLILFLMGFSISGFVIQGIARGASGHMLPPLLAAAPALGVGIAAVKVMGGLVGRLIPRDETFAVSAEQLVGRTGVVMRGVARSGMAAEARVRDAHGGAHYLMVEPDVADEILEEGADILLVRKAGVAWRVIRNPHPAEI